MVTKRQLNSLKRHLNAIMKEAMELTNKEKEQNYSLLIVCKESIEEQLDTYCKQLEVFMDDLPENEENDTMVESYENTTLEANCLLNQLKGAIKEHQRQIEAEEREKNEKLRNEKNNEKLRNEKNNDN